MDPGTPEIAMPSPTRSPGTKVMAIQTPAPAGEETAEASGWTWWHPATPGGAMTRTKDPRAMTHVTKPRAIGTATPTPVAPPADGLTTVVLLPTMLPAMPPTNGMMSPMTMTGARMAQIAALAGARIPDPHPAGVDGEI